jgi:hypothetical protein
MTDKWIIDMIEINELPEDLEILARNCGMDPVRFLLREYQSQAFYIPKITRLDSFIKRFIRLNSGKTYNQIAKLLGVSQPFIKKMARSGIN